MKNKCSLYGTSDSSSIHHHHHIRFTALHKIPSCGSAWIKQRSLISFFIPSNQAFFGFPLLLMREIFISLAILRHEAERARSSWQNHLSHHITQVEFIKNFTWVMNTRLITADQTDNCTVVSLESLQI